MNHSNTTLQPRETVLVLLLALLVGSAAFVFLVTVSGWLVSSLLTALAIMFLVGALQYLLWGRHLTE